MAERAQDALRNILHAFRHVARLLSHAAATPRRIFDRILVVAGLISAVFSAYASVVGNGNALPGAIGAVLSGLLLGFGAAGATLTRHRRAAQSGEAGSSRRPAEPTTTKP